MKRAASVAALVVLLTGNWASAQCEVPEVDFAIFRVDSATLGIKGYYRFTDTHRKVTFDQATPEPTWSFIDDGVAGDVFWWWDSGGDINRRLFKSRLTNEQLLAASSIWQGVGSIEFEPSPFITSVTSVQVDEPPVAVHEGMFFDTLPPGADLAWQMVRNTDGVASIADLAPDYEVTIFYHPFVVCCDGDQPEWFVVVHTVPESPRDFGVLSFPSPAAKATSGQCTVPSAVVHNFGDQMDDVKVRVFSSTVSPAYDESLVVSIAPDTSAEVSFPAFVPAGDSFAIDVELDAGSTPCPDTFSDNNQLTNFVEVTTFPVFARRTFEEMGYPGFGVPLDWSGDGRIDFVELSRPPKLYENMGARVQADVSASVLSPIPINPREIIAEDLTGNGTPEIVFVYFDGSPLILTRSGDNFVDWAPTAGIEGLTTGSHVEPLDLEGDGDIDLIFGNRPNGLVVFGNDGAGQFTDVTSAVGLVDTSQNRDIDAGDLNGDGHPDLLLVNSGATPSVYLNDTTGVMVQLAGPWDAAPLSGAAGVLFDYNDDDRIDIGVSGGNFEPMTVIYENMGGNVFVDVSSFVGPLPGAFAFDAADINRDGIPEILLSNSDAVTPWSLEDGQYVDQSALLIPNHEQQSNQNSSWRPMFVDLDGDRDTDIILHDAIYTNEITEMCAVAPTQHGHAGNEISSGCAVAPAQRGHAGPVFLLLALLASVWRRRHR